MDINKRDYFAAHALSGLLARAGGLGEGIPSHDAAAAEAFHYADAMLKLSKSLRDPDEVNVELINKPIIPGGGKSHTLIFERSQSKRPPPSHGVTLSH